MEKRKPTPPIIFIIFDESGNLDSSQLLPALFKLFVKGHTPANSEIIVFGRNLRNASEYHKAIQSTLLEYASANAIDPALQEKFSSRINYLKSKFEQIDAYQDLQEIIEAIEIGFGERSERIFYLSVSPELVGLIGQNLNVSKLADRAELDKIVIERPFGNKNARILALNSHFKKYFDELQIYRINHYLSQQTVNQILSFRFSDNGVESIWNKEHISSIEITLAEKTGVGVRSTYFDGTGALIDMVQNHLLEPFMLLAMEKPVDCNSEELRDMKMNVLKDVRRISSHNVCRLASRGQYTSGIIDDKWVKAYREESGVDKFSSTETFVSLRFLIDNERWLGVPFYLRTGKRLFQNSSYITINFKAPMPSILDSEFKRQQSYDRLSANFPTHSFLDNHSGFSLSSMAEETEEDRLKLRIDMHLQDDPDVYEEILLDIFQRKISNFMRADQIKEAWDIATPILNAWASNEQDLLFYSAGSSGPDKIEDDARMVKIFKKACGVAS